MSNKMGLRIIDNCSLINTSYIDRAKKLTSSAISDAMNAFGTMDYQIKPLGIEKRVIGTAITVNLRIGDNLMLHKAMYMASQGYVLVADGKGDMSSAGWGDMMTRVSLERRVEGLVLDGVVRDIADLNELKFPVFAKGVIPSGINKNGPGEINTPIKCGGTIVCPGDLIFGDEDGVVVVPRKEISEIITAAEKKLLQDEERVKEIQNGNAEPKWINEKLSNIGL